MRLRSFNEGAGIFPPGAAYAISLPFIDLRFNEGAGIFPPGGMLVVVFFGKYLSFNEGAGIFPPGDVYVVDCEQRTPASMKGREYSRPVP